jgi:hypothetical protein
MRFQMMKERRLMADIDKEEIPPSLQMELQWLQERQQARKAREPQRQDSVDSRRSSISVEGDGKSSATCVFLPVSVFKLYETAEKKRIKKEKKEQLLMRSSLVFCILL